MFEKEFAVFRFMQGYGDILVADIPDEDFSNRTDAGLNPPAWILGHLAFAADRHGTYAGGAQQLGHWQPLFGAGSRPANDAASYPSKEELLSAWHAACDRLVETVRSADPAVFDEPTQGPLAETLPTVGEFLAFSMTGHTSLHLGQLSAWRRAVGKPPMF